jgi:uridine kinase
MGKPYQSSVAALADNDFLRRRAEIPIYSFNNHQRESKTTSLYSPHVLVLEGILALHDPRVLELLDMKVCYFNVGRE